MFQVKNIQSPDELFALAQAIHDFLKHEVHADDVNVCVERGHELTAFMANTGKMLADAKYWKDKAVKDNILMGLKDYLKSKLPASTLNELVKAETKDLNYLVTWIEQLDKECKYQLEWIRSCLSLQKTEMQVSSYSTRT